MVMKKMKITTRYLFLGGIYDDNDNKNGNNKGYSSLTIILIMTLINQYTKYIYRYTNLDLPTFFCKKSHILFSCSGIFSTLKFLFRETPVER